MLVGLLRYAHGSLTGMWKLLYQQVTLECIFLVPEAQFVLVCCLVGVGLFSRDTTCGRPLLPLLDVILLTISQVFLSLNSNCVSYFPTLVHRWRLIPCPGIWQPLGAKYVLLLWFLFIRGSYNTYARCSLC